MCPEVITVLPVPARGPKTTGLVQLPFAVADDEAVVKPLSVISSPLGTVAAEPSSAVKFFWLLLIDTAKTITISGIRIFMAISARLLPLANWSTRPILLNPCLG